LRSAPAEFHCGAKRASALIAVSHDQAFLQAIGIGREIRL
jgi:hypothetical protein